LYKTLTKVLDDFRDEVLFQKPNQSCAEILKTATVSTLTEKLTTADARPEAESEAEPETEPEAELEVEPKSKPESGPELRPKHEQLDTTDQVSVDESFLEDEGPLEEESTLTTEDGKTTSSSTPDRPLSEPSEVEVDQQPTKEVKEQVMVYIEEDIEPFVGTDLITYNLHKEDLVTIPKPIADILLKNKKARIVETNI
jgi:hypothetical protein